MKLLLLKRDPSAHHSEVKRISFVFFTILNQQKKNKNVLHIKYCLWCLLTMRSGHYKRNNVENVAIDFSKVCLGCKRHCVHLTLKRQQICLLDVCFVNSHLMRVPHDWLWILDVSPCCRPLSPHFQGGAGCHEYPQSPCRPTCHDDRVNVREKQMLGFDKHVSPHQHLNHHTLRF